MRVAGEEVGARVFSRGEDDRVRRGAFVAMSVVSGATTNSFENAIARAAAASDISRASQRDSSY
jgi:hypothetical protein